MSYVRITILQKMKTRFYFWTRNIKFVQKGKKNVLIIEILKKMQENTREGSLGTFIFLYVSGFECMSIMASLKIIEDPKLTLWFILISLFIIPYKL